MTLEQSQKQVEDTIKSWGQTHAYVSTLVGLLFVGLCVLAAASVIAKAITGKIVRT